MNTSTPLDPRSLAHRLTSVGHTLHHRLFAQLRDSDLHPKTVFLLRAIDGRIEAPWIAERLARGGKRVSALVDRGWISSTDDGWALADEGRAVLDRLDADRSALLADVPAEELERLVTALDALEGALGLDTEPGDGRGQLGFGPAFGPGFGSRGGFGPFGAGSRRGFGHEARGFGRDADDQRRRGHGGLHADDGDTEHAHSERDPRHGRGFGPGFGHARGHGHGHRQGHGHGHGHGERGEGFGPGLGHGHHQRFPGERSHGFGERGHGRGHRAAQRAYERGFDAGFSRGREATASGDAPASA